MTVIERNWRCAAGEVDVVALDGETVVLVEVKTRRTTSKGTPDEAVTVAKQRRYTRLASAYLKHADIADVAVRFDVVSILVIGEDRALLRHHRGAFWSEDS
jgi:putative endonuclease